MRKAVTLFLSLALAIGLSACGSSADRQGDSPANASKQAENSPAESESTETEKLAAEEGDAETEASQAKAKDAESGKTLVVYYSASGNTKKVAEYIATALNGDTFELVPQEPYSDEDLDWTDDGSRVVYEHDNPDARDIPLVETAVPSWESYDTVFIGYPIWWGIAAWPTDTFVKANDFTGKTVIPFCTSTSSGLGDSGTLLEEMAGTGNWLDGERFSSGVSEENVREWAEGIESAN